MTKFKPNKFSAGLARLFSVAAIVLLLVPAVARAGIDGVPGTNFTLTASEGYISVADGGSIYSWGYSTDGGMQLPGPTLIVTEGTPVEITLNNALPAAAGNVSIVFPGHQITTTTGGVPGQLTQEALSGGSVTYTFTASEAGTYQYHSGTRPDLQVEMGLYGALIVEPAVPDSTCSAGGMASAYNHPETCFDREYLYLLSEVDIDIHQAAEDQASGSGPIVIPVGSYASEYWLINGRAAPDTMAEAGDALLSHQPYNAITRMHPGDKVLLRVVGAGREMHPFHTHGNHVRVLARDGRLLVSETNVNELAGPLLFTIPSVPGGTTDAIFEWTGKDLGWDIYATSPGIPVTNAGFEDPAGANGVLDNSNPLGTAGGWTKTGNGHIFNPGNNANAVEGSNIYRISSGAGGLVEQVLGNVLTEGTFTLSVAVGDQISTSQAFGTYQVQLGVDNGGFVMLAEDNNTLAPDTGYLTSTVAYTAAAGDANLNLPLMIRLSATAGPGLRVFFDDVRLAHSATHNCTPDADGYHSVAADYNYREWCADHDIPIPVELPALSSLAFGGFYSGSPYLGALGSLPPGEGGLNPDAGFSYMWHSHNERELVNNDVFPGGMMTMMIIEAPGTPIIE